ncbi:DUF6079 family protein [Nakamurella endophytica]|uniref:Phage resistance protein n=1 Tax=Nakamurella endophytica TaxID=1748367 RepID=A0A917SUW8_9ACTN|nr:DUF6079 family protein [Nakamurella endophytica]GGL99858.1 hypothetical protein GCM10011594_19780 [Nakamurella endophytica]
MSHVGAVPRLRDIFEIPESAGTDDYVLRLSESVEADQLAATLDTYVVTPELARAFDQALSLVAEAQRSGENRAAFIEGSFGSGKSHFMAVLHALLGRHPKARAIAELQPVLSRHPELDSNRLLRLTFHFLDSRTVESALFSQYLEQVTALHPEAPPPVLHSARGLFDDAAGMRTLLGDAKFFECLNAAVAQPGGSIWSRLGVTSSWTAQRYDAAVAPQADPAERTLLQQALTGAYYQSYSRNSDWLSLEDGLAAIAEHAKSLGYDGVVLLLDELVLWLTFLITERERLNAEVQKITKLVESSRGRLAVPITSFVARQHDLRRWLDRSGLGAEQDSLERALQHQSGRFATIPLGEENLPAVAHRRLLQPRNPAAAAALEAAFGRLDRNPRVWEVLRNNINVDEDHRGSDTAAFRLTYPFSPALIDTLKSLAGLMQRERTALKVMQKMLIDGADRLTIDHVMPVGDAFDDIVTGTSPSSDPRVAERFRQARDLWTTKLRPFILSSNNISADTADADLPPGTAGEVRLAKTLILAALAPNVPALSAITASRLAALNHGSIREVLPGDAASQAVRKVRDWRARVPEVRVPDGQADPLITVTLADVDYQGVLDRARNEDTEGRRRDLVREMLFEELRVDAENRALDGVVSDTVIWRGTKREVEYVFGNIRDRSYVPDDALRARPGTVRMVLDYPFDAPGQGAREDHIRLERYRGDHDSTLTLAWVPTFFTAEENEELGRLVILNTLLRNEKWAVHAADLSEYERPQARAILEGQQSGLRSQFSSRLMQVYGIAGGRTFLEEEPPLVSLSDTFRPQRPVGATFADAAARLIDQAFTAVYPDHPEFSPPGQLVTDRELTQVLSFLRRADADADGRVVLERHDRDTARRIVQPLGLAKVNETHLIFTSTEFATWDSRISQALSAAGYDATGSVPVEVLRSAISSGPADRRGLSDGVRDLIVAAWALRQRRAWYQFGTPIPDPPTIRDIRGEMELRCEPLPESRLWGQAVERFGHWFGQGGNEHLTASNLAVFVDHGRPAVATAAAEQRALVHRLEELDQAFDVGTSARIDLARALVDLFERLQRPGVDRVAFVALLAEAVLPGTDQEIGRSLSSAQQVVDAIAAYPWARFASVRQAAEASEPLDTTARAIVQQLRTSIRDHEYVTPLARAITVAADERDRWLEGQRPVAPVTSALTAPMAAASPAPSPSGGTWQRVGVDVENAGAREADVRARIVAALAAFPHLDFEVMVVAQPRDGT